MKFRAPLSSLSSSSGSYKEAKIRETELVGNASTKVTAAKSPEKSPGKRKAALVGRNFVRKVTAGQQQEEPADQVS